MFCHHSQKRIYEVPFEKISLGICFAALSVLRTAAAVHLVQGAALTPQAQPPQPETRPALLEQPMSDFTLPAYKGGAITLSRLRGKNVMIIFPRGYAAPNYWCTICNYW